METVRELLDELKKQVKTQGVLEVRSTKRTEIEWEVWRNLECEATTLKLQSPHPSEAATAPPASLRRKEPRRHNDRALIGSQAGSHAHVSQASTAHQHQHQRSAARYARQSTHDA